MQARGGKCFVYQMKKCKQGGGQKPQTIINGTARLLGTLDYVVWEKTFI